MLTEILSIISFSSAVVSVLGMKRAREAQRIAQQAQRISEGHASQAEGHVTEAGKHKDASQRAALASQAQNKIAQAVNKLKSEPSPVVRSRADRYDEIKQTAAAKEDKQAIQEAIRRSQSPTWLPKSDVPLNPGKKR